MSLRAYAVYLSAMLIFAASRLVVIVGINFGTLLVRIPDPKHWDAGSAWYHRLLRWDTGWYAAIVKDGYQCCAAPGVEGTTAFYPLYPLVTYAVKSLFGINHFVALLLVANVASLFAVLLMTKFVKDELGHEIALLSVTFFCFFPSSLFLSAGYTESLFLVFVLLSFILMAREKFVLAAAMAGLSLGTRSTGIVMIPVILWEMGLRNTLPWPRFLPRMALCGVLAASGLLIYMAYLGIRFGHPLAFATVQVAWHSGTFLDRFVSAVTLASFRHGNLWDAGWFLCFLALTIWSFRRLRFTVALYGLGTLALPYLTLGVIVNRYMLVCFPAFMCLGILCKGRPWLVSVLIGIFGALLLQTAALFSQWYWVG
jgi:Gpi18-like mannosyltransferase